MATQSRKPGFPDFFGDFRSADMRKQFIEGPADATRGAALGTLLEVAGLLSVVPNAVVASQQRELERLKATRGEGDPRVVELEASLARAAVLGTTAKRGQARLQRVAVAFADGEDVFHGFVSDSELNPLSGLTVRMGKDFSATTDDDGYFRIPLGTKGAGRSTGFTDLLNNLHRARAVIVPVDGKDPAAAEPAQGEVEIVAKGTVLHTDPNPVPLESGRVYREYVIAQKPAGPRDFSTFVTRNAPSEAPEAPRRKGASRARPARNK